MNYCCLYWFVLILGLKSTKDGIWALKLKSLPHQTAMPQSLYSVPKPCQRAVESPRNTPKMSNLPVIACTQRPHSVPTASTRRSHSVFISSMTLLRRASSCCSRYAHGVHTTFSRRAHSVLTAIIAFKIFLLIFLYFEQPYFANTFIYFYCSRQFVMVLNSC